MSPGINLPDAVVALLRCPSCEGELRVAGTGVSCAVCQRAYPVVDGVPVLIDEDRSIFSIESLRTRQSTTVDLGKSRLEVLARKLVPTITKKIGSGDYLRELAEHLLRDGGRPTVLIVGAHTEGSEIGPLLANPSLEVIESDVTHGGRTKLICDAHCLPFESSSLDAVVIQSVLEHVVDPQACVGEIHRVLRPGGFVYAVSPLTQTVHGGPYDFFRFTHSGHRRLFRHFDELKSGPLTGPGSALAWSYSYFLLSFVSRRSYRKLMKTFAYSTSFFLKYFDRFLIDRPGAIDASSEFFFLGRKGTRTLPDRELIPYYRGAQ